jgi:aspartate carbamoyltransferase catalytic subunit
MFLKDQLYEKIFAEADRICANGTNEKSLEGKVLAAIFYEPSTRTRLSFETAMLRLGGQVISTENAMQFSSAVKGETIEDSAKIISGYADVIVLRHPEIGAAARASSTSSVPVINAGDGAGEHPTQAMLDFYTIRTELKRNEGFTVTFVGDLLYGRTIHSLIRLLSCVQNVKVNFVSPKSLAIPEKYTTILKDANIPFVETEKLQDVLAETNILYMTRVQKERFASEEEYMALKDTFILTKKDLKVLPRDAAILHPLPRVSEVPPFVDADPRAAYFREAQNGLYVRMALLKWVFGLI